MSVSQVWNDVLMMDPRVQIGGFTFIMDLNGITPERVEGMWNARLSRLGAAYFQDALPLRSERFIYVNTPSFMQGTTQIDNRFLEVKERAKVI